MSRHTPGPWTAEGWNNTTVNAADGSTITAAPGGVRGAKISEIQANARLIAAAPDLLAALELFLAQYHVPGSAYREARPEIQAALAAISKAKGGAR